MSEDAIKQEIERLRELRREIASTVTAVTALSSTLSQARSEVEALELRLND